MGHVCLDRRKAIVVRIVIFCVECTMVSSVGCGARSRADSAILGLRKVEFELRPGGVDGEDGIPLKHGGGVETGSLDRRFRFV